ncbi:uncharacterized protein LOC129234593 [Uloborus diversus]|uniref:uncharacterized protein LOC129234593 n=1 Tax=Uloborus diversus TaxID=327109 RepID=UPI002408FBEC|nr:uncharacterized protein LOC129234593 [Uloborus diversus]
MVNFFIIADLNCKVLYSEVYNFSEASKHKVDVTSNIVQQVKKEFDFNFASSTDVDCSISDFDSNGIFNVKVQESLKPTVWHSFRGCLYILVCDDTDNRVLAARTLIIIIRTLRDILKPNTLADFLSGADVISLILNTILPSGQLLFLHNQAVQQITKDIQRLAK